MPLLGDEAYAVLVTIHALLGDKRMPYRVVPYLRSLVRHKYCLVRKKVLPGTPHIVARAKCPDFEYFLCQK